ncbi:MAG: DUF4296 domain-containing protein [Saprospiraceae bacterium]|nr:DUF4296 domain-containing protein [Saprospiraceae bacterium]MCB9343704.1 DUF4296 domain-containing protein [Lewinellaceae bacterium]
MNRFVFFIWISLFVSLMSCQEKKTEVQTLDDEKLARVMADLNVAEAATLGLSGYPKDSLIMVYYNQVFEIHGTSLEEYEKNLRIVSADLPHLKQIVDMAGDNLNGDK